MCTIAGAKVRLNYNCYNVYFNECLPKDIIVEIYQVVGHFRNRHPPTQSMKNRIGGCHISLAVRSRPMSTPHHLLLHTSAIRLHTSSFFQLFHNHSHGHTFPIAQKTSEPKVHEVSRYSRIFRMIEPSHFRLSSCSVCCHVMATSHRSLWFSAGPIFLFVLILSLILFRQFQ